MYKRRYMATAEQLHQTVAGVGDAEIDGGSIKNSVGLGGLRLGPMRISTRSRVALDEGAEEKERRNQNAVLEYTVGSLDDDDDGGGDVETDDDDMGPPRSSTASALPVFQPASLGGVTAISSRLF